MDKEKLKKFRKKAQKAKKDLMPKKKPIISFTDDNSGVIYSIRGENVSKDDFMKSVEEQGKDEAAGAGGYSQGGEVRGTGSAVKGLGFKGVF